MKSETLKQAIVFPHSLHIIYLLSNQNILFILSTMADIDNRICYTIPGNLMHINLRMHNRTDNSNFSI